MAIAPSSNLLSALSQLQTGTRPAAAGAGGNGPVRGSFAAQLTAPAQRSSVERAASAATAGQASAPARQPPVPVRGGYLGQHVNIIV
ncbi:hypothetical protein [Ferrovibrio sp.]|uniref:hypothetical protein n=1 Tax=Ferrovibrio sp. TaxID=1917215 RepID=UPI00311ED699